MPRPQFTLRSLLVAMLVVACPLAWIANDMNAVRRRRLLIAQGYNLHGAIAIGGQLRGMPAQPDISWLRRLLGDSPKGIIFYFRELDSTGDELARAKALFPEATVLEGWHRVE